MMTNNFLIDLGYVFNGLGPKQSRFPMRLTHFRMVFGVRIFFGVYRRRESFFHGWWNMIWTIRVYHNYRCIRALLIRHCIVSRKKIMHNSLTPEKNNNLLMATTNDIRQFACQSRARSLVPGNKSRCSVSTPAWKPWWCSRSSWARFLALLDQIPDSWAKRCFGVEAVPAARA